uniref:Putative secreted protein n=1 Tax=Ixodes ricinus TaxID=34613 RepID=A0A6B0UP42_IXORI
MASSLCLGFTLSCTLCHRHGRSIPCSFASSAHHWKHARRLFPFPLIREKVHATSERTQRQNERAWREARIVLMKPVQSSSVQSSPVQSSPVQSSPVQSSPVQSSPVQSSPVQSSANHDRPNERR